MSIVSPLTQKRLAAFRRNRRAWFSFLALAGIFLFCLAAEVTSPADPQAVVDPATLQRYCRPMGFVGHRITNLRSQHDEQRTQLFAAS